MPCAPSFGTGALRLFGMIRFAPLSVFRMSHPSPIRALSCVPHSVRQQRPGRLCSAALRVHALTDPICSHPLCIQPGPCNMTDCNTTRRIHTTRRVRRAVTRAVATGGARVPARQDTRGTPCSVQADDGHHHREAVIARCGARALLPRCRRSSGLET